MKKLFKNIKAFFINIKDAFFHHFDIISKGDYKTRLSYLFMGFGNIFRGQIIKGLIFLVSEIAFIFFFIFYALPGLSKLKTLGTVAMREYYDSEGIIHYETVDNSFLIILYGVVIIAICLFFLVLYFKSVKSSYKAQLKLENGEKLPSFKKEILMLLDERYHITLLTLPSLGVIFFTVIPLIVMILLAFTNYDKEHLPPGNLFSWVGIQNISGILGTGRIADTFRSLLFWTLTWAVSATFSNYILGMILAILINKKGIKFKKVWRSIFVLTIAVPQFVTLLLMSQMLADQGVVNAVLENSGLISEPIKFLTKGLNAKITVILVNIWVGVPYTMLITTGILMNIPKDLYESASLDGASPYRVFMSITLPYMLFVTTPYLITQFIGNINNFNVIYLLTAGGPLSPKYYQAGETDLLITWLFKLTVDEKNYSLASTIGILIFVISAVFSLIAFNLSSSTKKEEEFQ